MSYLPQINQVDYNAQFNHNQQKPNPQKQVYAAPRNINLLNSNYNTAVAAPPYQVPVEPPQLRPLRPMNEQSYTY